MLICDKRVEVCEMNRRNLVRPHCLRNGFFAMYAPNGQVISSVWLTSPQGVGAKFLATQDGQTVSDEDKPR